MSACRRYTCGYWFWRATPLPCGAVWMVFPVSTKASFNCGTNVTIVDDVNYTDTPTTLQLGGVSKPSDSNFSETDRKVTWKNTSIKRIGQTIAARYHPA